VIKTICRCDRCGKEFQEDKSVTIVFRKAKVARGGQEPEAESKLVSAFASLFSSIRPGIKDFCPECIEEIKNFMKGDKANEDSAN